MLEVGSVNRVPTSSPVGVAILTIAAGVVFVRPGGVILAHDVNHPGRDPRSIKAVTTNSDLETSFLMMDSHGIAVTLKKR